MPPASPPASKPKSRRRGPAALAQYNARRNFKRTAEPPGLSAASARHAFVVQQHDATRMHYDFRLELDGVLLSWAIPKGPSLDPDDKRLAVRTEDHPIAYRNFEGTIPHGEYGGGPVIVWDRGRWMPEGDPHAGLRKGHLRFSLDGEKLHGRYSLVRLRDRGNTGDKQNWLLIKGADAHARKGAAAHITQQQPRSVLSGRRVEEMAAAPTKPARPAKPAKSTKSATAARPAASVRRGKTAAGALRIADLEPQLATLVDRPPNDAGWLYEVKFDGYRMLAAVDGEQVHLRSRNHLDWTSRLSHIASALGRLGSAGTVLDGELCAVDAQGLSHFQSLQNLMPRGGGEGDVSGLPSQLVYYLFDLLAQDGIDLRDQPLVERKQRLHALLGRKPPAPLVYSDHLEGEGRMVLNQACALGLEGLIAKRGDAPYRSGRTRDWLKLKCQQRQEFVIAGMVRASGTREGFRSLVLGLHDGKVLRYAGRVGTGFTQDSLRRIAALLARRVVPRSPLSDAPRLPGVVWVKPDLVCEVEYTQMTASGVLRHPSFQGLRNDKPARAIRREPVVAMAEVEVEPTAENEVAGVRISSPSRVMDATSGVDKLGLARYHQHAIEHLMPYLSRRPMSLVRCPQGDARQCFFQKHRMAGLGDEVHHRRIDGNEVMYVESLRGVLQLVQFNVVEFHGWGARIDAPSRPDWMVFDLDPDQALAFDAVIDAALEVREVLRSVGLQSWVKTTGGKGLHVTVPLVPEADWQQVKLFSKAVAQTLAERDPGRYVATSTKARRKGRIFIDYLRNGEGATAVLPYSPRARPGMTVAMPVHWRELRRVDPRAFTVSEARQWLARRKRDPWEDFLASPQRLPSLPRH